MSAFRLVCHGVVDHAADTKGVICLILLLVSEFFFYISYGLSLFLCS